MSLNLRHLLSSFLLITLIFSFQNCGEAGGPLNLKSDNNSSGGQEQQNGEELPEEEDGTPTTTPTPAPPAFSASYQAAATADQISYGLIQTADGGFLSGGTMTDDPAAMPVGELRDIQVVKWNMNGPLAYARRIATDRNDQVWSVNETNTHYMLSGFSWVRPNNVYRAGGGLIVRINKNDGSVFQTDLYHSAGEAWDQFHDLTPFTDAQGNQSYIATGKWQLDQNDVESTLLVKLDANLDVVWARSYGIAGESHVGRDVIHVPNQGFFVVGRRKIEPNVRDDITILKVSETGTLLAAKSYVNTAGFDVAESAVWNNGELIVSGVVRNMGFGGGDGSIIRLDANLNLVSSYVVGGSAYESLTNVRVSSSGDILLAGHTESVGNGFLDSWVMSLDSSFQFKWSTVMGKAGDDNIYENSLVERVDGGIAVMASENANVVKNGDMSSRNSRLILLSQYGKIETGCVGVYPNQVFGMQTVAGASVEDLSMVTATRTFTRTQLTLAALNANATASNTCQ